MFSAAPQEQQQKARKSKKSTKKHKKITKTQLQRTDDTTNSIEADLNKNKEEKLTKDAKKRKYHPHTNRRRNC